MAYPSLYDLDYSYTGFAAGLGDGSFPGTQLDNDLAGLTAAQASFLTFLQGVTRSDGHLANQSVGPDQLSPALSIGFTNRGTWAVDEEYSAGDGVARGEKFYSALTTHTATSLNAPDLDPEAWMELFSFASVSIVDGSIAPAKLVTGQGEGFRTVIGATTAAYADSVGAAAVSTVRGGVASTYDTLQKLLTALNAGDSTKLNRSGDNAETAFFTRLKWLSKAVGEFYVADSGEVGVDIPPSNPADGMGVWVELTAGLTGSGQFNEGKLSTESVTGSAPLVQATATVTSTGSSMNGQTIRLLNTERRFLRAGSAGTLEADAMQGHIHSVGARQSGSGFQAGANIAPFESVAGNFTAGPTSDGTNGTPRTANESRSKNIGVRLFRRVG